MPSAATAACCQVGSQQRSMAINRIACELVRSGGLGKLLEVRAVNYPGPEDSPAEPFPEQPVPAGLDWDVWLNQAAWRGRSTAAGWAGWRWRDFAGGEMTNWGAHGVDQIQWALGMDGTGPVEIWPVRRQHGQVAMRYANGVEVHFVLEKGPMGGAIFVCEKGKLEINRNKFASNPPEIAAELLKKIDDAPRRNEMERQDRPSGRPAGICRIGWIASARGRSRWPTWRSAIARSGLPSGQHHPRVGRRLHWDPAGSSSSTTPRPTAG